MSQVPLKVQIDKSVLNNIVVNIYSALHSNASSHFSPKDLYILIQSKFVRLAILYIGLFQHHNAYHSAFFIQHPRHSLPKKPKQHPLTVDLQVIHSLFHPETISALGLH